MIKSDYLDQDYIKIFPFFKSKPTENVNDLLSFCHFLPSDSIVMGNRSGKITSEQKRKKKEEALGKDTVVKEKCCSSTYFYYQVDTFLREKKDGLGKGLTYILYNINSVKVSLYRLRQVDGWYIV